jgi:uncharacterized alkaline shock family protein YloU
MTDTTSSFGSIHVASRAIATIAYHAALTSYGVVGLAHKNIVDGLAQALVKDPTHGVEVHYDEDKLTIDLYVIIEYGTRIKSVTASAASAVRYQVESALGIPVESINIHVKGLRVSDLD